jgi:hypothetical protein
VDIQAGGGAEVSCGRDSVSEQAGKAARNERRKLRGTFYNGMAIAFFAVGYLSTLLAFGRIVSRWEPIDAREAIFAGAATVFSLCLTAYFHVSALRVVGAIED